MPLEDVRILELTSVLGGPLAGRLLADLGADVIKIEQPGSGDASRKLGPYFLNGESAYFLGFNRNKRSVTLNLQTDPGREAFYALAAKADVVLDNFRPGVLDRLRIDHETLKKVNPSIISASLSGFGQDGPYAGRPAFDGVVQALGGAMSVTGNPGDDPVYMGFPMGDVGGGWGLAFGVLTALHERSRTGEGKRVDVSMLDMQVSFQAHLAAFYLASGVTPQPIGSGHPSNIPAKAFRTSDERWVQIHCSTEPFWFKTADMMAATVPGYESLPDDPRFKTAEGRMEHRGELEDLLAEAVRRKTQEEWKRLFAKWDVPGAPINDIADVYEDPQVLHRNMLVEIDHPSAGAHPYVRQPHQDGPRGALHTAADAGAAYYRGAAGGRRLHGRAARRPAGRSGDLGPASRHAEPASAGHHPARRTRRHHLLHVGVRHRRAVGGASALRPIARGHAPPGRPRLSAECDAAPHLRPRHRSPVRPLGQTPPAHPGCDRTRRDTRGAVRQHELRAVPGARRPGRRQHRRLDDQFKRPHSGHHEDREPRARGGVPRHGDAPRDANGPAGRAAPSPRSSSCGGCSSSSRPPRSSPSSSCCSPSRRRDRRASRTRSPGIRARHGRRVRVSPGRCSARGRSRRSPPPPSASA